MKLITLLLINTTVFYCSAQSAAVRGIGTPTLHVFGDSLSDVGTLHQLTLGVFPPGPYWEGRFSSGPVWNEYLAKLLGYELYNKAIGGSTSDNNQTSLFGRLNINIPSIQTQINYFKFTRPLYMLSPTRSMDIAVIELGSNDYFAELPNLISGLLPVASFVDTLISTLVGQLEQLRELGFKNIIVINLPAVQFTPIIKQENFQNISATAVTHYNNKLFVKVNEWLENASGIKYLAMGNLGEFVDLTVNSPAISAALNITDVTQACIKSIDTSSLFEMIMGTLDSNDMCLDPSAKYFFDGIHPSERVQRLYGYYCWQLVIAASNGKTFELSEASLLSLIDEYNLGSAVLKPVSVNRK